MRTIDEFRSERITVQVAQGQRAEIEIVDGEVSRREHLFTSDEVAAAQASERTRGDNLALRVAELERALAAAQASERTRGDNLARRVAELERALAKETKRAEDAENKLMRDHVCTGGCSGDQHVAFVGRKALTELENQVAELTRRIDNARVLLSEPKVTGALNRVVRDQHESSVMALAIEKALDTLA